MRTLGAGVIALALSGVLAACATERPIALARYPCPGNGEQYQVISPHPPCVRIEGMNNEDWEIAQSHCALDPANAANDAMLAIRSGDLRLWETAGAGSSFPGARCLDQPDYAWVYENLGARGDVYTTDAIDFRMTYQEQAIAYMAIYNRTLLDVLRTEPEFAELISTAPHRTRTDAFGGPVN